MMHLRRGVFDGRSGHAHDLISASTDYLNQLATNIDATKPTNAAQPQ